MKTLSPGSAASRGDAQLWAFAFLLSLLGNLAVFGLMGVASIKSLMLQQSAARPVPVPQARESTVTIFPEMILAEKSGKSAPPKPPTPPRDQPVARTSEEQRAPKPDNPLFQGERDTRATSDRAPDPTAPPLPSQAGVAPKNEQDYETTRSDYQDGALDGDPRPAPSPAEVAESAPAPTPEVEKPQELVEKREPVKPAPPAAKLLEGPHPVDVPAPPPTVAKAEETQPPREIAKAAPQESPKPAPPPPRPSDPAFKGFQQKTAIRGSISRSGPSALDVEDTPLGRYQAAISRAVEQEWQRNCVRHRDFITPGFLTVRFFVETTGRVRSVQFVGDMETGEVQKGFTLNSIRDAPIPAMPAALKKEHASAPLEIIFNFYF